MRERMSGLTKQTGVQYCTTGGEKRCRPDGVLALTSEPVICSEASECQSAVDFVLSRVVLAGELMIDI